MEKNYNSPLELIYCDMIAKTEGDMETKTEDAILEAIRKIGISIDKSALIEALTQDRVRYEKAYRSGYDARDSEIVRCKNCKYWGQDDPAGDGCECNRIGGWWLPEEYCSCGERREADEDNAP